MSAAKPKSFCLLFSSLFLVSQAANAASLTALRAFGSPEKAAATPQAELIEASDGKLYGTTAAGGSADKGTVFRMNKDGTGFLILRSFGSITNDGQRPVASVIEASDGFLYGTTGEGGEFGRGTVFQLDKAGGSFALLKSFDGTNGAYPEAKLLEGSDGLIYGTTSGGGPGTNDYGVVFRLNKNGLGFQLLKAFSGTNGANPEGGLLEAADGGLYGVTLYGGGTNVGTLFRLEKDGSSFSVLKHFLRYASPSPAQTNGYFPYGQLVEGTNGFLFGTTSAGGRNLAGTVYRINTDGSGFATLRELASSTGSSPLNGLALASDGLLYGTTFDGGTNGGGVVFRIDQNGSNYMTLTNVVSGQCPAATVLETSDGNLIGTTQLGGVSGDGTIFKLQKNGAGFTTVHNFSSAGGDGESSYASLTLGSDGRFYGTTRLGSASGAGALFTIDPLGRGYQIIAALSGTNGANPTASLIELANGVMAGTSPYGGSSNRGTIFAASFAGQDLSTLHSFGVTSAGHFALAALTKATNGFLYGVTTLGGASAGGTLFRVSPDGSGYTVLRHFASGGFNPMQPLLQASDGLLYGTTYFSYLSSAPSTTNGCIFRIDENGNNFAVLKYFSPQTNGANPMSPLLEASDGKLYGTTYAGGTTNDAGTVFRLNKDGGSFEVLKAFIGVNGDGRHPCGRIVEASDGFLYGTTERGGTNDQGTLFRLAKDGSGYSQLARFDSDKGAYPRGGVALGPNDALYGTTDQGGVNGVGAIFRYGTALEYISQVVISNQQAVLTCIGEAGTNYIIERTTDLTAPASTWSLVQSTNAPASGQFLITDQLPNSPNAFYRMKR